MTQEDQGCDHDGADETVLNGQAVSPLVCSGVQDSPGTRITTELLNRGNDRSEQGNMAPPSKVYRMSPPRSDTVMENLFFTHKPIKAPAVTRTFPRPTPRPQETKFPLSTTRTLRSGNNDLQSGLNPRSIACGSNIVSTANHDEDPTPSQHIRQSRSPSIQFDSPHSNLPLPDNEPYAPEPPNVPPLSVQDRHAGVEATADAVSSRTEEYLSPVTQVLISSPVLSDRTQKADGVMEEETSPGGSHTPRRTVGCHGRKTEVVQHVTSSETVLGPNTTGSRIEKSSQKQPQRLVGTSPHNNLSGNPSEEDLLLLLMKQNRTRNLFQTELQRRYQTLRQHSAQLLEENRHHRQQLVDTTKKWHTTVQNHHVLQADVQAFKNKYSKLKKWALEMHEEYSDLRQCGDKVFNDMSAIKTDIMNDAKERIDLLEKCQSAITIFDTIKESISELKARAFEFQDTKHQLGEVQARFREHKLQNISHASYIQRLEKCQQDTNNRFHENQDLIRQDLAQISHALKNSKDEALAANLARVSEMVQEIQEQGVLKPADLEVIKSTYATNGQNFTAIEEKLCSVQNKQLDHHHHQMTVFTTLKEAIDGIRPDLDQVQSLQKSNQTLALQVRQAETTSKLANREKAVTQLFTSGLLEAHKQMINSGPLKPSSELTSKIEQLRSMNNQLHINLQHKSSEATVLGEGMKRLEQKAENLSSQLAERTAQHETSKAELNFIKQQHSIELLQSKSILEAEVATRSQEITDLNREMETSKRECQNLNARITTLVEHQKDLQGQLQANEIRLLSRTRNLEELQSELGLLREQCKAMQITDAKLQKLQLESESLRTTSQRVIQLETENTDLQRAAEGAQLVTNQLQEDLDNTRMKVGELQSLQREVKSLRRIRSSLEVTAEQLEADLHAAQQNILSAQGLHKQIEDVKAQHEQLQKVSAAAAQNHTSETVLLELQLAACHQKIIQLEQAVDVERQNKEKLSNVQLSLQEKTHRVQELELRVLSLNTLESQLQILTGESQRKDTELATMHDHIEKLQTENRPDNVLDDSMPGDEVSDLSQEIVLSLEPAMTKAKDGEVDGEANSEVEDAFERPKRAANMGHPEPLESVVVPDSQDQELNEGLTAECSSEISSPLSNLDMEEFFDKETTSTAMKPLITGAADKASTTNRPSNRLTSGWAPEARPMTSNDDMLLRSSDPGESAQVLGNRIAKVQVPASTGEVSKPNTRNRKRVRYGTPVPQVAPESDHIENFTTPLPHSREQHRPNSAVKRKATNDATENASKMKKPNLKNVEVRARAKTPVGAASHPPPDSTRAIYDLPSSSRRGASTIGTNAPAPGKATKKAMAKPTRWNKQGAQMEARFGDNAPSYSQG